MKKFMSDYRHLWANPAVERMRASRLGEFAFLAQWRLARTAHRHR